MASSTTGRWGALRVSLSACCVASAFLAAGDGRAQVYRCASKDGGAPAFSDRPCAGGEGRKLATASAGSAKHALNFDVQTSHYDVRGSTLDDAYAQIRAQGPGGYWAMARWNARYKYETLRDGNDCRISDLRIDITAHILMPRWIGYAQATRADQAAWDRMHDKLLRHEQGHVQYGREFAVLLREQLAGMGAVRCDTVQARAQGIFEPLLKRLRERDTDYDRRTEHGIRQDNPIVGHAPNQFPSTRRTDDTYRSAIV